LVVSPTPTPTPPPPSSSSSVLVQAQCEGCPQGVTVFGGVTMTFTAPPYGQRPTPFLMDLTPGATLTVTAPATANAGGTPVRFLRWMAIGTGRALGTSTTLTVAVTGSETFAAVYGP
ncbi:MAG: hypothetical protein KIT87_21700, partial [Anaerolineae bacterium]|nr:hypothetical protein [Anaerolineae bacterium]